MNPGYLSLVLICIALILFGSGWKEVLIRGISHRAILLFFVLWLGTLGVAIPYGSWRIHACVLLVGFIAASVIAKTEGFLMKCHLVSLGLLLGSIYFFMQEASHLVPAMMAHPDLQASLFLGFTAFMLTRQPLIQLACISMGLVVGEGYSLYVHQTQGYTAQLGGPLFQDRWWLSAWMARGCGVVWQGVYAGSRHAARLWLARRKEERDDRLDD